MSELARLIQENQKLKQQINNSKGFTSSPIVDDAILKGGYRVVRTVKERNAIDCCHRKLGMRVMVIGQDYSFKDYILKGEETCSNEFWALDSGSGGSAPDTINDSDVTLLDDYSFLDVTKEIQTQQDLNQVLANLVSTLLSLYRSSDKYFIHDQFSPSSVWVVEHDLEKKPSVTITDSSGNQVEGDIKYISEHKLTITFNFPFSGYTYLN